MGGYTREHFHTSTESFNPLWIHKVPMNRESNTALYLVAVMLLMIPRASSRCFPVRSCLASPIPRAFLFLCPCIISRPPCLVCVQTAGAGALGVKVHSTDIPD